MEENSNTVCSNCGIKIHPERAEIISTCIDCTDQRPYIGYANIQHKTANETIILRNVDSETLRLAQRANRRAR